MDIIYATCYIILSIAFNADLIHALKVICITIIYITLRARMRSALDAMDNIIYHAIYITLHTTYNVILHYRMYIILHDVCDITISIAFNADFPLNPKPYTLNARHTGQVAGGFQHSCRGLA